MLSGGLLGPDRDRPAVSLLIILSTVFGPASNVLAQEGTPLSDFAEVWGRRWSATQYIGVDNFQTTPNPSPPSGTWTAGPNAVSDELGLYYKRVIESGPTKACDIDCGLHPYGGWAIGLVGDDFVDTTLWLGAGLTYRYYSTRLSGTLWNSQFCSGIQCYGMTTGDLLVDKLPYVSSGGESLHMSVHWGSIITSAAKYKAYNESIWRNWCWTSTWINVTGGTVSACSNWSWTSSY